MEDYKKIPTTREVWAVIHASHYKHLKVFSTYSNPHGDDGMSIIPTMMTEYGFVDSDYPIIGAETTWSKQSDGTRADEKTRYWICVAIEQETP